jgi:hypothetical protein
MNHPSLKPQTVMDNIITSYNNMNHSSVKHQTVIGNNIRDKTIQTASLSNLKQ